MFTQKLHSVVRHRNQIAPWKAG